MKEKLFTQVAIIYAKRDKGDLPADVYFDATHALPNEDIEEIWAAVSALAYGNKQVDVE